MSRDADNKFQKTLSWLVSATIVIAAIALGLLVLYLWNYHPRTDDATVLANFIGMAPQVEGRIIRLSVRDNQFVRQGDLLFEIDPRPFQYALQRTVSEQAALEGEIEDERRRIAALVSAVSVAEANIESSKADVDRWAAAVEQSRADVSNAEQGVVRARAEWTYADSNLRRIEPLLAKQFVTADQVDRARATEIAESQALKQASSQLRLAQAALTAS